MITVPIIFFGISFISIIFLIQASRGRARIIGDARLSKMRGRTEEIIELIKELEEIEGDLAVLRAEVIELRKLAIKRKKRR